MRTADGVGRIAGVFAGVLALSAAALLGACSPYALRGKVIEGDVSFVAIVDASDPRLSGPGVPNVALDLTSNPERLNRKMLASGVSGPTGEIDLRVEEIGAGVMTYDVALAARRDGYAMTEGIFRLPPDSKRALVMLKRGAGRTPSNESLIEEFRRYNR